MKVFAPVLLLSASLLAGQASAALINYDIQFEAEDVWSSTPERFPGIGKATFDSSTKALVDLHLDCEVYSFSWNGNAPVSYDEMENGEFGNLYWPTVAVGYDIYSVLFNLDQIMAASDEELFQNLAHSEHEVDWTDGESHYWGYATLSRVQVPEPTTLALLGLGLAGFAFTRKSG